ILARALALTRSSDLPCASRKNGTIRYEKRSRRQNWTRERQLLTNGKTERSCHFSTCEHLRTATIARTPAVADGRPQSPKFSPRDRLIKPSSRRVQPSPDESRRVANRHKLERFPM